MSLGMSEAGTARQGRLCSSLRGPSIISRLASFGGGLSAWSREVIVVEKKWMADEEFLSAITMCRILPGANQVNLAVFVGSKFRGLAGAGAAVIGLSLLPVLIVLGLGYAYFQFHRDARAPERAAWCGGRGGRANACDGH